MYPNYCCSQPNCCNCCTPQNCCSTSQNCCSTSQNACCMPSQSYCKVDRCCCSPIRRIPPLSSTLVGIVSSSSKRKLPAKNGKKCIKSCKKEKCPKGNGEKKKVGEPNEKLKKGKRLIDEADGAMAADDPVRVESFSSVSFNPSQQASLPTRRMSQNSCPPLSCDPSLCSRRSLTTNSPGNVSPGSIRKVRNHHDDSISQSSYGESSRKASDQQQLVNADENSISQRNSDSAKRARNQPDYITNEDSLTSIRSASQKQLKNKKNFEYQDKSLRKPMEVIAEEEEDTREVFTDGGAKSIQDTCADFLNIVNDSVLDTVKKSVECMMQQYFCQTMERIDCLCAHMMRNDCLISKMYIDLMEKIRQQNEKSQLQFKCLCEFLIDSQKDSTPMPNPCACFENLNIDFAKSPNYLGMESMAPSPWANGDRLERSERSEQTERNKACGCPLTQDCYKTGATRRNSNDPSRLPSLTPSTEHRENGYKLGSLIRNSNDPPEISTLAASTNSTDKPGPIGRNSKDNSRLPSTTSSTEHPEKNDKPGFINRNSKDNSRLPSTTSSTDNPENSDKPGAIKRNSKDREKAGYNRIVKADASCMTDKPFRVSVSKYSGPFISRYDLESLARSRMIPYQNENMEKEFKSSSRELQKPHSDLQLRYALAKNFRPRINRSDSSLSIT